MPPAHITGPDDVNRAFADLQARLYAEGPVVGPAFESCLQAMDAPPARNRFIAHVNVGVNRQAATRATRFQGAQPRRTLDHVSPGRAGVRLPATTGASAIFQPFPT